jgi:hypothetical protein
VANDWVYEAEILENIAYPASLSPLNAIVAVFSSGNVTYSVSIAWYPELYTSTFKGLVFKL